MKRRTRWILAILILLLLPVFRIGCIMLGSGRQTITVSRETTYLTEPLRSDGSVDYYAVLNRIGSEGVTPENNASVRFWEAIGPKAIPEPIRAEFFKLLGIPPLPDAGDYLVTSGELSHRLWVDWEKSRTTGHVPPEDQPESEESVTGDEIDAQRNPADEILWAGTTRPWSRKEFPLLAEWLDRNEKPLALALEGTRRPRRYEPLCRMYKVNERNELLIDPVSPGRYQGFEFESVLQIRAMQRLGVNRSEEAWNDLLSCHRLARLVCRGAFMDDVLAGIAIDREACAGDFAVLQHATLGAEQIAKMRADLDGLPPMPKLADTIETERLAYLDIVAYRAKKGLPVFGKLRGDSCSDAGRSPSESQWQWIGCVADPMVDWNIVLRDGNAWYDRLAGALHKPTRTARNEALKIVEEDLLSRVKSIPSWSNALKSMISRKAASESVSQILLCLQAPCFSSSIHVEDPCAMTFELDKLAFALAAYRAEQGSYPEKLDSLMPKYVAKLPVDIFNNDADLHYRREGNGYVLYSVGINERDDGDKTCEENTEGEGWDDIAVRMPATEKPESPPVP